MQLHRILALAVLGVLASQANAQSTGDVSLSGTLSPGSCTPSIANGGRVDFDTIPVSSLATSATTTLATRTSSFSFACTPALTMGFRLIDNRHASQLGTEQSFLFGLGNALNGAPIGNFSMKVRPATITANASSARLIGRMIGSWSAAAGDNFLRQANPDFHYALAAPATLVPLGVSAAGFDFDVAPTINSKAALQITQDVSLDGSVTLEVLYL